MSTSLGDGVRVLPHAVVSWDTLVQVVRHGDLLTGRLAAWRQGQLDGASAAPPPPDAPPIDKSALRAAPDRHLGPGAREGDVLVKYTSGTTGPPVPILWDAPTALEQMVVAPRRIADLQGPPARPDAAPGPMVTFAVTEAPGARAEIWTDPWGGYVAQVPVDEGDPGSFHALIDAARRLRPAVLTIKPTLLVSLLEHRPEPRALEGAVDLVVVSGSDFGADARSAAEAALGVAVREAYGLTEFGLIAAECDARAGLHLDPDVHAEILDPETGAWSRRDGAARSGELVLTSARNAALPLTRYRTGDFATLDPAPCACGRRTPRLRDLSGRLVHNFRLADGRAVSPARFNALFARHPIAEFQMDQSGPGRFRLTVEPRAGHQVDAAALAAHVREIVGPGARLEVALVERIPRGSKFQRYRVGGAARAGDPVPASG